jgi:hypothetical protein
MKEARRSGFQRSVDRRFGRFDGQVLRPTRWDAGVPSEEDWLFPGRKLGKPMTTPQLSRLFHEAADAAGIKRSVTLHACATASRPTCSNAAPYQNHPGALGTTARYSRVATGMIARIDADALPSCNYSQPPRTRMIPGRPAKGQPERAQTRPRGPLNVTPRDLISVDFL